MKLVLIFIFLSFSQPLYAASLPSTLWSSNRINETLLGVKVGSILEGGETGIATLSQKRLTVYKWEGEGLQEIAHLDASGRDEWIKLTVADVDQNGQMEIIVSAVNRESVYSFVFEFSSDKIIKKQDFKYYVSSIAWTGENRLIGQKRLPGDDFSGPVFLLNQTAKGLEVGDRLNLPMGSSGESYSLYSIQGFQAGEQDGFVRMSDTGKINYYIRSGEDFRRQWTSGGEYGGNVIYLDQPLSNALKEVTSTRFYIPLSFAFEDQAYLKSIKPLPLPPPPPPVEEEPKKFKKNLNQLALASAEGEAPLALPVEGATRAPNKDHLYVIKNEGYLQNVIGAVPSVKNTQIVRLDWTGYGFQEGWNSPRFDGAITDFQIIDWEGDGKPEVLATLLLRDRGYADTLKRQDSLLIVLDLPD